MVECPHCGSRFLRPAEPQNFSETIGRLRLRAPFRCTDCRKRFIAPLIVWRDLLFARCPTCRRMDLKIWTGKTFEAPFWMAVKIRFGGRKWRCEYCRINFASFRRRKEIFSADRWKKFSGEQGRGGRTK
jgi:DNA-directed RNA polymerase subunit RPC12/RpoP